jgi:hypothetical protein
MKSIASVIVMKLMMFGQLLETFAMKNNFEYDTAENGLLALQAFRNARRPYDIVLMGRRTTSLSVETMLNCKQTSQCRS